MKKLLLTTLILTSGCSIALESKPTMKTDMFPQAKKDQIQHVINLPKLNQEDQHKVEIFLAKKMAADCNLHSLQAELTTKDLKGWGYNYYEYTTKGHIASTMMACQEQPTMQSILSQGTLLRYNSRMPLVIYTPKDYTVEYRVWSASPNMQTTK